MAKSSEERKASNIKKVILQFMKGRRYRPMSIADLFKRFQLPETMLPLFRRLIKELIEELAG